jgi:hypothetical protein
VRVLAPNGQPRKVPLAALEPQQLEQLAAAKGALPPGVLPAAPAAARRPGAL